MNRRLKCGTLCLWNGHRATRHTRLQFEQLEARFALSADLIDSSRLISDEGTFNGSTATMPLEVTAAEFSMPSGSAVFGFQVRSTSNDAAIPRIAALQDASGTTLSPVYRRPIANTDQSSSVVLYQLSAGAHQMLIQGGANSHYKVEIFLVGDLNGDRTVDVSELNSIRLPPILGSRLGDANYSLASDVNRDGRVSSQDYFLARANANVVGTIPEDYSIVIDNSLQPQMLNYFNPLSGEADPNRPLARIAGPNGELLDFVTNEIVLMTSNDAELTAFLQRWNATLLHTEILADAGINDIRRVHTIRIDTSLASSNVSTLADSLKVLTPSLLGETRISSEQGVRLLQVTAAGLNEGLSIGANFLMEGRVFQDGQTLESSTYLGSGGYSRNAFDWSHLTAGSIQDIGVPQAWQRLELAGRLQPSVDLAILDMGFASSTDDPSGAINISNVPFVTSVLGQSNLIGCGSGNPCPWHGTNVLSTAMATADNGFGSAGVAANVARAIRVFTLYDVATSISAVLAAKRAGADIINMSYGGAIPAGLDVINLPFEAVTAVLRGANTLLFAAAGNAGVDIDKRAKFLGVSLWEVTNYTPAENAGVIGVGGLAANDTVRHSSSNYGSRDVDIYAPYIVYAGPDPSTGSDVVQQVGGTSFSSPFAAGVAALIWSASPALSANQVENVLTSTAHQGRFTSIPGFKVDRYVNAFDAVESVLQTQPNHAPFIEVSQPINGQSFARGVFDPVPLRIIANDFEDGSSLTVQWYSDRDGLIATGSNTTVFDLSYGLHQISVRVTDRDGLTTSRSLGTVTIVNQAPTVEIDTPTGGQLILLNQSFKLRATSRDLNEVEQNYQLIDSQIQWFSNRRGFLGFGHDLSVAFPDLGSTTITVVATDSRGLGASDTVSFEVRSVVGSAPSVTITSPNNNQSFFTQAQDPSNGRWYVDVQLRASVSDLEDQVIAASGILWTTNRTDLQSAQLGSGRTLTVRLYANPFTAEHRIRVSFTDSDGNTVTDSITIQLTTLI